MTDAFKFSTQVNQVGGRITTQRGMFEHPEQALNISTVFVLIDGTLVPVDRVGVNQDLDVVITIQKKRQSRLADFSQSPIVLIPLGAAICLTLQFILSALGVFG